MLNDYLYDGYDDGYYVPSHEYYRLKRQEEQRRRWQAEQAYRQEQERLWHEREQRRRRAALEEQERRRRKEHELQEARAELLLREDELRKRNARSRPKYQLVRGSDGMIYRVPVSLLSRAEDRPPEVPRARGSVAGDGIQGDVKKPSNRLPDESFVTPIPNADDDFADPAPVPKNRGSVAVRVKGVAPEGSDNNRRGRRKKVTVVVVEDASDSEDDGDELKSVWRNRRPSPGEWIEPVEG
jgi:hypothetical protein